MRTTTPTADASTDLAEVATFEDRLWLGIPELTEAEAKAARLAAAITAARTYQPTDTTGPTVDALLDQVAAGQVGLEPLAEAIAEATRTNTARSELLSALVPAHNAALSEVAAVRRRHGNTVLATLHGEVVRLIDAARPILAAVEGLHTAEDAIDADRIEAWKRAAEAVRVHQRMRATQLTITRATASGVAWEPGPFIERFGRFVNVWDFEPWASELALDKPAPGAVFDLVPPYADGLALLRFLARPDVQPWVPTVPELDQQQARLSARLRKAEADRYELRTNRATGPFNK